MSTQHRSLRAMHHLSERVLAKEDPIRLDWIDAFVRNPQAILPPQAVALYRIPPEFKVYSTVRNGDRVAFYALRGDTYVICVDDTFYEMPGKQGASSHSRMLREELLGILNGQPVFVRFGLKFIDELPEETWDTPSGWELYIGKTKVWKSERGTEAPSLLHNGTVAYIERDVEPFTYRVMSWSEDTGVTELRKGDPRRILNLFEDQGRLIGVFNQTHHHDGSMVDIRDNQLVADDDTCRRLLGSSVYGITVFPDGMRALTERAAHSQVRWVFGKEQHPAFRWVSDLFEHSHHGLCYLARIDNTILTMKVDV